MCRYHLLVSVQFARMLIAVTFLSFEIIFVVLKVITYYQYNCVIVI